MSNTNTMHKKPDDSHNVSGPQETLAGFIAESANMVCADCGTPDPKWVAVNFGAFICIKCSGAHRSLGAHISKVLSVNLDEWTHEEVNIVIKCGGNGMVNAKYEASIPDNCKKPKPDSSIEERLDFIKRKYEMKEFLDSNKQICLHSSPSASNLQCASTNFVGAIMDKKNSNNVRMHSIGQAFRNSWRRKDTENKAPAAAAAENKAPTTKKSNSMVEKVNRCLAVTTLDKIGEGKVREHSGDVLFPVHFTCLSFKVFREVVEGVVHKILKHGVFLRCGPIENLYLSNQKMTDYHYQHADSACFLNIKTGSRIEKDATLRCVIIGVKYMEAQKEFQAVVGLEGDHLGPI